MLEREIRIACSSDESATVILRCFGSTGILPRARTADLEYSVRSELGGFVLERADRAPMRAEDEGELLFELERDTSIALQGLRRDLYFLHAASLATERGAVLFVGASGAGKSTLAWGLVHHGFQYLSDELAPVDLREVQVLPYPRALCLKAPPPGPYALPAGALETSRGFHVPVSDLGEGCQRALGIRALFFLESGSAKGRTPALRPIGAGEATTRLLANALNPLAHPSDGLDAALAIARCAPRFGLRAGELQATCELVGASLEGPRAAIGSDLRGSPIRSE